MNVLSKAHQTSLDITPYFITYNIQRAERILTEDIDSMIELIKIMENHMMKQFDPEHSLNEKLEEMPELCITRRHLNDILRFEWDNHDLTNNNSFID